MATPIRAYSAAFPNNEPQGPKARSRTHVPPGSSLRDALAVQVATLATQRDQAARKLANLGDRFMSKKCNGTRKMKVKSDLENARGTWVGILRQLEAKEQELREVESAMKIPDDMMKGTSTKDGAVRESDEESSAEETPRMFKQKRFDTRLPTRDDRKATAPFRSSMFRQVPSMDELRKHMVPVGSRWRSQGQNQQTKNQLPVPTAPSFERSSWKQRVLDANAVAESVQAEQEPRQTPEQQLPWQERFNDLFGRKTTAKAPAVQPTAASPTNALNSFASVIDNSASVTSKTTAEEDFMAEQEPGSKPRVRVPRTDIMRAHELPHSTPSHGHSNSRLFKPVDTTSAEALPFPLSDLRQTGSGHVVETRLPGMQFPRSSVLPKSQNRIISNNNLKRKRFTPRDRDDANAMPTYLLSPGARKAFSGTKAVRDEGPANDVKEEGDGRWVGDALLAALGEDVDALPKFRAAEQRSGEVEGE